MICFALMVAYKLRSFKETFDMYVTGMKGNLFLVLVLLFAWSISAVCKQLGTANYIVQAIQGSFPAWLVAPIIFIVGAIISFATGTSYGTFAILMPIAIPMANSLGAPMIPTIAAVFSGGILGDHCSPISDTTLLASMGAGCDHIEHVRTQLPYGILVGILSFVAYTIVFWLHSTIAVLAILVAAIFLLTRQLCKRYSVKTLEEIS
jgi:Na+/H+ antiporter NhaC